MFEDKKYIIATHNRVYGVPNALRDFLVEKKLSLVLFVAHPLDVKGDSFFEEYKKGKFTSHVKIVRSQALGSSNYIIDLFLSLWWILRYQDHFDVYIGINSLNTLSGLILKRLRKVDQVIFYATDYIHQRKESKLLNKIYHWIEKFAVKNSDEIWTTSLGTTIARQKYLGIDTKKYQHKLVPTGVWNNIVKPLPLKKLKEINYFLLDTFWKNKGCKWF